jgi:hypothetical protein
MPSGALARTTRLNEGSVGSFVSNDTVGSIAVDQSNGDVYEVNQEKVVRFDSTGAPKNFTAGPDAGTNTLTSIPHVSDIAIDNSDGPLSGSIYAVSAFGSSSGRGVVMIFGTTGESIGSINGAGTPNGPFPYFSLHGIAVDQSDGSLYIGATSTAGRIWRYAPNSPAGSIDDSDFTVTGISSPDVTTHLAAGAGSVYSTGINEYDQTVKRVSASAFAANVPQVTPTVIESEGSPLEARAIVVDPSSGDLYAVDSHRVSVFSSAGTLLYKFGASVYFGEKSLGIAVKTAGLGPAAKVYVAKSQPGGEIAVFGPLTHAIVRTHPVIAAFGNDGSANSSFSANSSLEPSGLGSLAFGQASRSLFAVDIGVPGIYGFDASAPPVFSPLAAFSPLATAAAGFRPGLVVDNTGLSSAGNVYFVSSDTRLLYGFDSSGAPLGGNFPVNPVTSPGAPNGSPADLAGVGVDSGGNIWLVNRATRRILEYSANGAYLSSLDTSAQGEPVWIAFDSNDDMYVSIAFGASGVWKYTAPGYTSPTQVDSHEEDIGGLAVDPLTHNLYVAQGVQGSRVDEYDSAGNFLDEFAIDITKAGFSGLAVDPTNHYTYVSDGISAKIYTLGPGLILPDLALEPPSDFSDTTATLHGSVGAQTVALSDCQFEYVTEAVFRVSGFSDLSSGGSAPCGSVPVDLEDHVLSVPVSGLSTNTTYSFRLSAANANGTVVTPAETFASLGPPLAETTGSPVRSATTAELLGRVDPSSSATSFHFEFGSDGPCDSSACASTEAVSAGSGDVYELASTQVSGLQPNTTYHYRIVADNGTPGSPSFGEDMTVTTRASDAPLSHGHFPGPPGSDRAYEQVSLPDAGGNPVNSGLAFSDDGDRAVYVTSGGNPSSPVGGFLSQFLAERVESAEHKGAWKSIAVMPPRDELAGSSFLQPSGPSDLSSFAVVNFDVAATQRNLWRLSSTAPAQKLFEPVPPQEYGDWYAGSDGSTRVVARLNKGGTLDPAYPEASTHSNLYDVSDATPKLASLAPGNTVFPCNVGVESGAFSLTGETGLDPSNWVSADGKLFFFPAGCGATTNLYMREFESEQTKLVSGPPLSGPQCSAGLVKSTAEAVFFWTQTRLSADDTNPAGCAGNSTDGDVYRYDIAVG